MKTKSCFLLKPTFKLVWLLVLIVSVACNNQKGFTQQASAKGNSPKVDIHTAVINNDIEAIRQHVKVGTNINEKDPFGGSSPLISASLFGRTEAAKILIDAGADINVQNNDGSTALHTAAFFCRTEIVKMLLDKGIDKTVKNNFGSTAYESVAGSFAEVKPVYDMMGQMLAPMGLELDYPILEKTRPEIAAILK